MTLWERQNGRDGAQVRICRGFLLGAGAAFKEHHEGIFGGAGIVLDCGGCMTHAAVKTHGTGHH